MECKIKHENTASGWLKWKASILSSLRWTKNDTICRHGIIWHYARLLRKICHFVRLLPERELNNPTVDDNWIGCIHTDYDAPNCWSSISAIHCGFSSTNDSLLSPKQLIANMCQRIVQCSTNIWFISLCCSCSCSITFYCVQLWFRMFPVTNSKTQWKSPERWKYAWLSSQSTNKMIAVKQCGHANKKKPMTSWHHMKQNKTTLIFSYCHMQM